jgi:flagellar motor switch/type III secretory pathway protein FliN
MSNATVRDLRLVPESVKASIQERLNGALMDWWQTWLPLGVHQLPEVEFSVFEDIACDWVTCDLKWQARRSAGVDGVMGWSASQTGAAQRLCAWLLGKDTHEPSEGDVAMSAALHAIEELNEIILGGCDSHAAVSPDLQVLSGVLHVVERRLGLCWAIVPGSFRTDRLATAAVSKAPEQLRSVVDGVTNQHIQVSVGLGDVDIQLSDLLALQAGDVIRFPSQLQGSVPVSVSASGKVTQAASGQLGQQDGHLVVKLLAQHRAV